MHCPICDKDSDTVTMEDVCSDCQQAIFDCIAGYPDLSGTDGEDPLLEEDFDDN